jgi:hypothetical protein
MQGGPHRCMSVLLSHLGEVSRTCMGMHWCMHADEEAPGSIVPSYVTVQSPFGSPVALSLYSHTCTQIMTTSHHCNVLRTARCTRRRSPLAHIAMLPDCLFRITHLLLVLLFVEFDDANGAKVLCDLVDGNVRWQAGHIYHVGVWQLKGHCVCIVRHGAAANCRSAAPSAQPTAEAARSTPPGSAR